MADKKITVLDDVADADLTPDEAHAIEVKVDKMLNPRQPEEPAPPPKIKKKTSKILVLDALDDTPAPEVRSAPPLAEGSAVKTKIKINRPKDETKASPAVTPEPESPVAESETLPTELTPEELPTAPLDIGIPAIEPEEVSEDDKDIGAEPAPTEQNDQVAEATPETEATDNEAAAKKYRPPDGPLPFKRAEPAADPKPLEQAAADLDDVDEDSKPSPSPVTRSFVGKHKPHRKGRRSLIVLLIVLILATLAGIPKIRAAGLNVLHVHGSLSVAVVDSKDHAPLSDVVVSDGKVSVSTDQQGQAILTGLKLGPQTIKLQKTAFASVSRPVVLAWKSTTLSEITLQVTGHIYGFIANDYVSDKPLTDAQADAGNSVAHADTKGLISVGVDASTKPTAAQITALGYLSAKVTLPSDQSTATMVTLVPSTPYVYVARQAGLYDVYKATVDGQNKKLLLSGTGRESSQLSLLTNGDGSQTALVSTRDNQRDKAGYLLDALTIINLRTGAAATVDHAQQIKLVGWFGNRLVYTALEADATTTDTSRYKLLAFDTDSGKSTELDHANTFNDVAAANNVVYYAASNVASGGTSALYKINPDGSGKQTLLSSNISSIIRSDYSDMIFSGTTTRYSYKLTGNAKPAVTTATESSKGRLYVDSPDGRHSAWADMGTGTLTLYNKATGSESVLAKQAGLSYPLGWLSANILIYRVDSSGTATDYVMSLDGGTAKKVMDVSDVSGPSLWQD